jgi:hypothetical protein
MVRPVCPELRKCRVRPGSYAWCQKQKCVASVNDTTAPVYLAELSVQRRRCEF